MEEKAYYTKKKLNIGDLVHFKSKKILITGVVTRKEKSFVHYKNRYIVLISGGDYDVSIFDLYDVDIHLTEWGFTTKLRNGDYATLAILTPEFPCSLSGSL